MRAEKSEKGHAFEGDTSGIQQAACEALEPREELWEDGLCGNALSSPIASSEPWISCPRHCEVCLGATVLGFHSALGTNTSTSSARDSSLIGPFSKSWLGKGLISWDLAEEFSGCV